MIKSIRIETIGRYYCASCFELSLPVVQISNANICISCLKQLIVWIEDHKTEIISL